MFCVCIYIYMCVCLYIYIYQTSKFIFMLEKCIIILNRVFCFISLYFFLHQSMSASRVRSSLGAPALCTLSHFTMYFLTRTG